MAQVRETPLPGVGVRHDFTTRSGQIIGVISHRSGRRELLVYDTDDPDTTRDVVTLEEDDTRVLVELLGASEVTERLGDIHHTVAGLTIDWVPVEAGAGAVGRTLADLQIGSRTGASVVAVVREDGPVPAPGADFTLAGGDTVVAVGTPTGIKEMVDLLRGG